MAKILRELLDQGLVTARDPLLLAPGELQRVDECVYRPNNPSICTAPGRTTFGTAGGTGNGRGLSFLGFDGNADQIVALVGTTLSAAPFNAATGTFAAVQSGLATDSSMTLDTVQYANAHYALTGYNTNRVLKYVGGAVTGRVHGLTPVSVAPVATTLGTGTWSSSPFLGNGVYWFLSTEVINPGTPDEIESTFIGTPDYAEITTYASQSIQVVFPAQVNSTATHRRLYISERQADTTSEPSLLVFRQTLGDTAMATTTVTLTGTLTTDGPREAGYSADSSGTAWTSRDSLCLLYTSPSPRDGATSRMPSSA